MRVRNNAKSLTGDLIVADETLIDKEIKSLGESLLEPFEPNCIKGASYDVRVGEIAQLPPPEGEDQPRTVALGPRFQASVLIPPGSTCVIRSLEKVHMPKDMKGRLALRAFHARRLIFFPGGIIDPGYNDYLFLPIANLGDAPVELKYEEAIITAEFIKLSKEAGPYEPSKEAPSKVAVPPVLFDRVKLSKEVQQQGETLRRILERLDKSEIQMAASQIILNLVVLAAIVAGAATAVWLLFPQLPFPLNAVALGVGAALGVVALVVLIRAVFRPRQR
jgi:deoxycytidine triphosphate deaminase